MCPRPVSADGTGEQRDQREERMSKQTELSHTLTELIRDTKEGKIRWNLEVQTTEANDPAEKPVEQENGVDWIVDECYVSYYCKHKGKEFCMITYELIKNSGEKTATSNMVFLPPLGVRFFDLHVLLPHSVETSAVLLDQIHQLWVLLLEQYKVDRSSLYLDVRPGTLRIED